MTKGLLTGYEVTNIQRRDCNLKDWMIHGIISPRRITFIFTNVGISNFTNRKSVTELTIHT